MDRVKSYRQMIQQILSKYAEAWSDDSDGVATELLFDETHDNYMLMCLGWEGHKRIDTRPFLVRLRNGKFYIDDDWSEDGIANVLVESGVPRDHIVLAFNPPELRELTEYAVA